MNCTKQIQNKLNLEKRNVGITKFSLEYNRSKNSKEIKRYLERKAEREREKETDESEGNEKRWVDEWEIIETKMKISKSNRIKKIVLVNSKTYNNMQNIQIQKSVVQYLIFPLLFMKINPF